MLPKCACTCTCMCRCLFYHFYHPNCLYMYNNFCIITPVSSTFCYYSVFIQTHRHCWLLMVVVLWVWWLWVYCICANSLLYVYAHSSSCLGMQHNRMQLLMQLYNVHTRTCTFQRKLKCLSPAFGGEPGNEANLNPWHSVLGRKSNIYCMYHSSQY